MKFAFEQSLLIAVRRKSFCGVLDVRSRTDAVALDPLLSQVRHVRGTSAHRWNGRGIVPEGNSRLDCVKRVRVEAGGLAVRTKVLTRVIGLHHGIVDNLPGHLEKGRWILDWKETHVDRGLRF